MFINIVYTPEGDKRPTNQFCRTDSDCSVLEAFWYGNIEPSEYDASRDPDCREILQLTGRKEEKLRNTMTDMQKELFAGYIEGKVRLPL